MALLPQHQTLGGPLFPSARRILFPAAPASPRRGQKLYNQPARNSEPPRPEALSLSVVLSVLPFAKP